MRSASCVKRHVRKCDVTPLMYLHSRADGLSFWENLGEISRSQHVTQRGLCQKPCRAVRVLHVRYDEHRGVTDSVIDHSVNRHSHRVFGQYLVVESEEWKRFSELRKFCIDRFYFVTIRKILCHTCTTMHCMLAESSMFTVGINTELRWYRCWSGIVPSDKSHLLRRNIKRHRP